MHALLQEHTHDITCKESLILWVTLHLTHPTCTCISLTHIYPLLWAEPDIHMFNVFNTLGPPSGKLRYTVQNYRYAAI